MNLILENTEGLKDYNIDEVGGNLCLPNASSINIFIGANNSGKSRFLRELMIQDQLYFDNEFNILINEFNKSVRTQSVDYNQLKNINLQIPLLESIDESIIKRGLLGDQYIYKNKNIKDSILNRYEWTNEVNKVFEFYDNFDYISNHYTFSDNARYILVKEHIAWQFQNLEKIKASIDFIYYSSERFVYIPTMRSAHLLYMDNDIQEDKTYYKDTRLVNDVFKTTLREYYKLDVSDKNERLDIFTGQRLYYEIVKLRNSNKDVREKFYSFEKFLGDNFFNKKQVDIIAHFDLEFSKDDLKKSISLNIEDVEKDKKIYELGDGLQALILLLFKIYMSEEKSTIFIDEPELNLHPGMQRIFLNEIVKLSEEKQLIIYIVTHSNHFLDLTVDQEKISIYNFINVGNSHFEIRNVKNGDFSILKDLGVQSSSVFIANCTIWVEGPSDVYYLRGFLDAYLNQEESEEDLLDFKEDIDYAFFEFGGNLIDTYIFDEDYLDNNSDQVNALALNNRIFLLHDNDGYLHDNEGEVAMRKNKIKRFEEFFEQNKINNNFLFRDTGGKEIENILNKEIWREIIIESSINKKTNVPDEVDLKDIIRANMDYEIDEIESVEFSKYLHDKLKDIEYFNKISKTKKTLYAQTFLKLVKKGNIKWEHIKNKHVESIIESLYDFIKDSRN
ncbi:hypothetical protein UJ101_02487 [Flavobacteriaceae bacterium UJ101]|nr:hypothetical protein UJ101_02487 [Flavobacteriaceae bacterium UJ101]